MDVVKILCPSPYCSGQSYSVVEESPGGIRRCDRCGTEFFSCPNPDCDATYSVEGNLGDMNRCERCGTELSFVPPTRGPESPSPSAPPDLALDALFGRYRILENLGEGTMGIVYLALDTTLERQVALKILRGDKHNRRSRFLREAKILAQFNHDNICVIHDHGEIDGRPFLTMPYIEGGTLASKIEQRDRPWDQRRAAEDIRVLALALAHMHRKIVHRDLKPANIMIDARGKLIVMDFGLARWSEVADPTSTQPGDFLGTPAYMAPEQAEGHSGKVGPRSDVYSLGVILYELLTRRRPFEGNLWRVLNDLISVEPPRPSTHAPDLDPGLESICLKAMAKAPNDRFDSMDEFARALQEWLDRDRAPKPVAVTVPAPVAKPEEPSRSRFGIKRIVPPPRPEETFANSIGMTLRLIPAGVFDMGSPGTDEDALDGEKPRHKVRITRPFYLGATEVTVGQFRRFVEEAKYRTEAERDGQGGYGWDEAKASFVMGPKYTWRSPGFPQGDDHPVVLVSWNDAAEFLAWLGRKEGQTYRLPTEAEWEYACRAGTSTKYWVGDDPEALAAVGNVADGTAREKFPGWKTINARDGYVYTAPVGRFPANAFGLKDVHGNVWEWCSDWYDAKYYKNLLMRSEDVGGPSGPATDRVVRGGSWASLPRNARSAYRGAYAPGYRSGFLGFRAARVQ